METRINEVFPVPPSDWIGNMLGVGAEIMIEFIVKIRLEGAESAGKSSQMLLVEEEH